MLPRTSEKLPQLYIFFKKAQLKTKPKPGMLRNAHQIRQEGEGGARGGYLRNDNSIPFDALQLLRDQKRRSLQRDTGQRPNKHQNVFVSDNIYSLRGQSALPEVSKPPRLVGRTSPLWSRSR